MATVAMTISVGVFAAWSKLTVGRWAIGQRSLGWSGCLSACVSLCISSMWAVAAAICYGALQAGQRGVELLCS